MGYATTKSADVAKSADAVKPVHATYLADVADNDAKMQSPFDETTPGGTFSPQRSMSFSYSPGAQPLPPYTIRRGVGVGGFGEVYFAVSQAGKEVALKRIQRNLDVELRGVSQCLNLKAPQSGLTLRYLPRCRRWFVGRDGIRRRCKPSRCP